MRNSRPFFPVRLSLTSRTQNSVLLFNFSKGLSCLGTCQDTMEWEVSGLRLLTHWNRFPTRMMGHLGLLVYFTLFPFTRFVGIRTVSPSPMVFSRNRRVFPCFFLVFWGSPPLVFSFVRILTFGDVYNSVDEYSCTDRVGVGTRLPLCEVDCICQVPNLISDQLLIIQTSYQ